MFIKQNENKLHADHIPKKGKLDKQEIKTRTV